MPAEALRAAIHSTRKAAKYHKREIGLHRKALRERMERLEMLRIQCEALGIAFITESEGRSHGSKSPTDN